MGVIIDLQIIYRIPQTWFRLSQISSAKQKKSINMKMFNKGNIVPERHLDHLVSHYGDIRTY
jgi:hypothetical protein